MSSPVGVTNTYLNSSRPRREWRDTTFLGAPAVGRFEFASATATTPTRIVYQQHDAAAQTVTTLGQEEFAADGTLTRREQYVGLVNSTALAAGQSQPVTYTVRTLVADAAVPDRTERLTVAYAGNELVTLPDPDGANPTGLGSVNTCRVTHTLENIGAGGAATQVSVETLHLVPGLGFVKSYYKPTLASFIDRNQTYLTELVRSNRALGLQRSTADAAPSLAQCSALVPGLELEITASDPLDANNAFRRTVAGDFQGVATVAVQRLRAFDRVLLRTDYPDPSVGHLRHLGWEEFVTDGTLEQRWQRTGRPDLRTTAPGAAVNFTEILTRVFPTNAGTSVTSNDQFRFDGFAKVRTPAGVFDTCKVTFTYGTGDVVRETYYHAPNLHWVRLDYTLADGTRATREVIDNR
jgi:hypothetical protein